MVTDPQLLLGAASLSTVAMGDRMSNCIAAGGLSWAAQEKLCWLVCAAQQVAGLASPYSARFGAVCQTLEEGCLWARQLV